jgi:hypothetical protein
MKSWRKSMTCASASMTCARTDLCHINSMCFFNEDDLYNIVSNEKLFSAFNLMEKERQIIFARVVKKIKYKHLAPVFDVSIKRTHTLYSRGIKKMKQQMIDGITNGNS